MNHFGQPLLPLSVALLCGCSPDAATVGRQRSSVLLVEAAPGGPSAFAETIVIPVGGGALDVQSAMFSIAKVEIEENTGEDEQNGEGGEGQNGNGQRGNGQNGDGEHGNGEHENGEGDLEDIVLMGPFAFDIAQQRRSSRLGGRVPGHVPQGREVVRTV